MDTEQKFDVNSAPPVSDALLTDAPKDLPPEESSSNDEQASPAPPTALAGENKTEQRISSLSQMQQEVFRLFRYAVSQTNIKIDKDLIDTTVAVLHTPPEALTREEEQNLWENCNTLTMLVHPATSESIRIAEEINQDQRLRRTKGCEAKRMPAALECCKQLRRVLGCLVGILLLFIFLQSYVILLTDALRGIEERSGELLTVEQQIKDLYLANPSLKPENPTLKEQIAKEKALKVKLDTNFEIMRRLSFPWGWLFADRAKADDNAQTEELEMIRLEQATRSILQVLNYYILPLTLGLLGAVAFIMRNLLNSLSTTSYTLNSGRRHPMRLALGALLGMISGIFLAPDQADLEPFKLSLVVLAFLMGYSVEFAFSIFDTLIERGRKAVISSDPQAGSSAQAGKGRQNIQENGAESPSASQETESTKK